VGQWGKGKRAALKKRKKGEGKKGDMEKVEGKGAE